MKKKKNIVWYLTQDITNLPAETDWLSPKEYQTAQSFKVEKRKNDWLLGRWTSKNLIQNYYLKNNLNYKFTDLEIIAAQSGQPQLFINGKIANVNISISHSEKHALCVLSNFAVGCDIEALLPRSHGLINDFFTQDEIALVENQKESNLKIFTTNLIWSAKESVLKVLKEGLRIDTRKITIKNFVLNNPDQWNTFEAFYEESASNYYGWFKRQADFILTISSSVEIPKPLQIEI